MSRSRLVLVLAVVVVGLLALALAWWSQAPVHSEHVADAAPTSPPQASAPMRASEADPVPLRDAGPRATAEAPLVEHRDRDHAKWSKAREEIASALERRGSSPASPAPQPEAEPQGTLSKEYIRERVREDVLPLVKECYENLLEQQPKSGGRMVLKFAIMGDEDVGGIVDGVELAEESEIQDADFRECLAESTMSAVFDPPEGGGRVEITYPFVFMAHADAETPAPG
jgi:hypothetical protein